MAARDAEVTVRRRGGAAVLDIAGEVDASAEATLGRAYEEAAAGGDPVVLNFTRTDYINSTGIAVIVGLLAQARARGRRLVACGLSDHYREIFEITRLADFMTIANDEDGALGAGDRRTHA